MLQMPQIVLHVLDRFFQQQRQLVQGQGVVQQEVNELFAVHTANVAGRRASFALKAAGAGLSTMLLVLSTAPGGIMAAPPASLELPAPRLSGTLALEQLLAQRRSVRTFVRAPLSLPELGQLLWAAQGISHPEGLRTAPSAGAIYPLEIYAVVGQVEGLAPGVYHYRPRRHDLQKIRDGDAREALARAALQQSWLADAAAVIAVAAVFERAAWKYGARAPRYVQMEAGHAGQNLLLQAEALSLGAVVVGAFDDSAVAAVLGLADDTQPLSLIPVGKKR